MTTPIARWTAAYEVAEATTLLADFTSLRPWMEGVALARAQDAQPREVRGRGLVFGYVAGHRSVEVRVPSEDDEARWHALCREINRRVSPPIGTGS